MVLGSAATGLQELEEVDELVEDGEIVAGSVGIAELGGDGDAAGGAMWEPEEGEQAPGGGVLAAGLEVVAVGR